MNLFIIIIYFYEKESKFDRDYTSLSRIIPQYLFLFLFLRVDVHFESSFRRTLKRALIKEIVEVEERVSGGQILYETLEDRNEREHGLE